jgi:diacylglycerol O-acyltransferase / wax synthase
VVVSNVPGPAVPLYLAGARMLTNYPCSIVTHGVGLNVTVQSYDQSLDFGLMADAAAMPDVRRLAEEVAAAAAEFAALAVEDADDLPIARRAADADKARRQSPTARQAGRA